MDEKVEVLLDDSSKKADTMVGSDEQSTENIEEVSELSPEQQAMVDEYNNLLKKYDGKHSRTLFEYCFIHNFPYIHEISRQLLKDKQDSVYSKMPMIYIDTIKKDGRFNDLTFFKQIKQENFNEIYSEDLALLSLSEDDRKNRQQVIDILSYDPFKDDDPLDKPQLYRDLTGMLTESMRKDVAKAKAALSIVRGYSNLEKYQQKITEIMKSGSVDEDTQKQLDQYIKVQKTLQDTINTTAEKNNFTVKGIGSNGKGMLSDVMNQIEERGIDEGITNFYDIATSKSIEEVANISFKAQLNQVNLSKTDYADILSSQCALVREAQKISRNALEAERLAKEKITKQELITELEDDYRKKGISEKEIQEFISREYHLYDGQEHD